MGLAEQPALHPTRVELPYPGRPGETLSAAVLRSLSASLVRLFAAPQLNPGDLRGTLALAVLPGQVLARTDPAATGLQVRAGADVVLTDRGEFVAESYGYACLREDRLEVVSPLWLAPQCMQAYWLLLDQRPHALSLELALDCLARQGIVAGLREDEVQQVVTRTQQGNRAGDVVLVAAGSEPVRGRDGRAELLLPSPEPGRAIAAPPLVTAGQVVARCTPPGPGVPGRDVQGREVAAAAGRDPGLRPGGNLTVVLNGEVEEFRATIDGTCRVIDGQVSVTRLLSLAGDVNLKTGNVHFAGEVFVSGSVLRSLSVRAAGSVTVVGSVEADAVLVAQGDVVVGHSIAGRRTRVVARGDVRVGAVREATVAAAGDLVVAHGAQEAYLRAGGSVVVGHDGGKGSVVGGQIWAGRSIDLHTVGSEERVATVLVAGLDPEQAQELDRIEQDLQLTSSHIQRLMEQLGLQRLDLERIRQVVESAAGTRRQVLRHRVQNLSRLVRAYQHLRTKRRQLRRSWEDRAAALEIRVRERAFPGVQIRVAEHRLELTEPVLGGRFRVRGEQLVIQ